MAGAQNTRTSRECAGGEIELRRPHHVGARCSPVPTSHAASTGRTSCAESTQVNEGLQAGTGAAQRAQRLSRGRRPPFARATRAGALGSKHVERRAQALTAAARALWTRAPTSSRSLRRHASRRAEQFARAASPACTSRTDHVGAPAMTALRAPLKLAGVLGLLWTLLLLGLVPQSLLDRQTAQSLVYSVRGQTCWPPCAGMRASPGGPRPSERAGLSSFSSSTPPSLNRPPRGQSRG